MAEKESNNQNVLTVVLSNKVRRGSIKVSEIDLSNLRVGIVDDVVITKVGENDGVIEMLFSDSKVRPGYVLVSANDAVIIGVEDGDHAVIEKLSDVQESEITENPILSEVKSPNKKPSTELSTKTSPEMVSNNIKKEVNS